VEDVCVCVGGGYVFTHTVCVACLSIKCV